MNQAKSWLLIPVVLILVFSAGSVAAQQEDVSLYLDIKPGSCINPLNVKSHGILTMAILGTEDFDVEEIDATTVMLMDELAPVRRIRVEDVGAPPADGFGDCGDCPGLEPDGYLDLVMKFKTDELVALGVFVSAGFVELTLNGELMDGTPFVATDCVFPLHVVSSVLRYDETDEEEEDNGKMRQRRRGRGQ